MRSRMLALGIGIAVAGFAVASAAAGWLVAAVPDPGPLWTALPLAALVPAFAYSLAPAPASLLVAGAAPGLLVAAAMLLGRAAHGHAGALATLAVAAVLSILLLGPLGRRAQVELTRPRRSVGRLALVGAQAGVAVCFRCRRTRLAVRRTGAVWHVAATVLTAGLWAPVWIAAARRSAFRCLDCGWAVGMPEVAGDPVRLLRTLQPERPIPTALPSRG